MPKPTLKELIVCEISDFVAALGGPGYCETPQAIQAELLRRFASISAFVELRIAGLGEEEIIGGGNCPDYGPCAGYSADCGESDLLLCPFCGEAAFFDSIFDYQPETRVYAPSCTECSCELMDGPINNKYGRGWYASKPDAAEAWNKRRSQ